MSVLELSGRPFVVFDPANDEHRQFYYNFVKNGTWGRCPYRFVVPEDHGNLVTMIQRSLVKYYVEQEFEPRRKRIRVVKIQQK
jgi:hypothetical protein